MEQRVHNFSAGPAALPLPVLEQVQKDLLAYPGAGASVMEISHRSKAFSEIHAGAKANIQTLLSLPDNYSVLFLPGVPDSMKSCASKWERVASGEPDAVTTASFFSSNSCLKGARRG